MTRLRWSAVVGVLLGVVALWPRPRADEPVLARVGPDLVEEPEPMRPDAPLPLVKLLVNAYPNDPSGRDALYVAFGHVGGGTRALRTLDDLGEGAFGLPWLIAHTPQLRIPPSKPIRDTLTLVGLRPAIVGGWLADVWPQAAVAAVVAEERWSDAEWYHAYWAAERSFIAEHGHPPQSNDARFRNRVPPQQSDTVRALASELTTGSDPWVGRVASAYVLDQSSAEERERVALDLLASDPNPVMQDIAVSYLQMGLSPLDAEGEALLRRIAHERPEHASQLGVYGIRATLRQGDVERATSFLPQIEEGARHLQQAWLVEPIDRGLHTFRGQLAARGRAEVTSWQSGLVVLAHRCAEQTPNRATVRGAGVYDAGWRWRLTPEDDFTACFTGTEPPGPPPPEGQRVDLTIRVVPE